MLPTYRVRRWIATFAIFAFVLAPLSQPTSFAQTPRFSTETPDTVRNVNNNLSVSLPITNSGNGAASNVQVTSITLNSATRVTPASLPVVLGEMPVGATLTVNSSFNISGLTVGNNYLLTIRGTYEAGGTTYGFAVNRFVIVPPSIPPSGATFSLFINPDDPLLVRAQTPNGEVIEYFGEKNDQGFAIALTSVRVQSATGQVTKIFLDEQARPIQIQAFNGATINITWQSNTSILITAISPNGSLQVNVPFNLTTQTAGQFTSLLSAKSSIGGLPLSSRRRIDVASQINVAQLNSATTLQPLALATSAATSLVNVVRCGTPVSNATVEMAVIPESGEGYSLPGTSLGAGAYSVSIPTTPSQVGEQAESICESIAGVLGLGCDGLSLIPEGSEVAICTAIAAAIDLLLGGPTGEGLAILAACESGFAAARLYCATLGGGPVPGAPSILEVVCGNISEVVDRFASGELLLTPSATIPGEGSFTADSQNAPGSGPFPSFTVDAGGEVEIVSFTTSPADPAPFQSYVATAEIRCAAPNTTVTIDIIGTDGYTDSRTVVIQGDSSVSLFVPGAEAGVLDLVTVQVAGGPVRQVALIF